MKTFTIVTYPICGGIAVKNEITLRFRNEIQAIKKASQKYLSFGIYETYFDITGARCFAETKYFRNIDGEIERYYK